MTIADDVHELTPDEATDVSGGLSLPDPLEYLNRVTRYLVDVLT